MAKQDDGLRAKPAAGDAAEAEEEDDEENPEPLVFRHVEYGMSVTSDVRATDDLRAMFWSNPVWSNPVWYNIREFATETPLPNGTLVQIGGEHKDQYDQYFMVYNDVIVCLDSSADEFEIYGYLKDVFPPTDAHTATFIPSLNAILILGNMSAPETDQDITANSSAPVYILDLDTWNMTKGEIVSDGPGIIWLHAAALNKGVLRVTASQGTSFTTQRLVSMKDGKREKVKIEHRETWELDVAKWTWKHQAGDRETVQKKKKKKRDDSRRRGRGH